MLFSWLTEKEKLAMNPAREATTERPILSKLLENLGPGDILVIWKLDRLGRSLKHLIDVVQRIDDTQDWFEEP